MAGPNPVSKTLSTLQSAYGFAKNIADLEEAHAVKLQIGELLTQILSAQESAIRSQEHETALTRQVHNLEDRIREMETWSGQKERYQLTKLPPGVFVYEIKEAARGDEPPHYVCAKCFEQQKRSFLNSDEPNAGLTKLHCPSCGWEDKTGHWQSVIAKGVYMPVRRRLAEEWLARFDRLRDSESENRKKRYDKIAAIAAIVAAVAATIGAIASIMGLF